MQIKCEIKRRRNTKRIVALPQYFSPLENFLEQINLELKVVIYEFFSTVKWLLFKGNKCFEQPMKIIVLIERERERERENKHILRDLQH